MFLPIEIHTNKLAPYSELMIFIRYKNNRYHFMYHRNTIFYSTHTIFDKKFSFKCTNSHVKEHKLYDESLDNISPEIELLAPNSSEKIDLLQYLFHIHSFLPLVLLYLLSLISLFSLYLLQSLKNL